MQMLQYLHKLIVKRGGFLSEIISTLLVDLACDEIKDDILNKRLVPGQKIIVRELSERYNISVTPIKQALNRLVSEGIVEGIPRRGMIVRQLSVKDIVDYVETRRMIEMYSIPYVLEYSKSDSSFLEQLEGNLNIHSESIMPAYDTKNFVRLHQIDFDFHTMIVATIQNDRILDIYRNLGTHCTITYLYGKKVLERTRSSLEEHKGIYEAIKNGDAAELAAAITRHIDNVRTEYTQNISELISP